MITVIAAVLGECCKKPHIRFIGVATTDPERAITAAVNFLANAEVFGGLEVGDVLVSLAPVIDAIIAAEDVFRWCLQEGDEVIWNDPAAEEPQLLKVQKVCYHPDMVQISHEGGFLECLYEELTPAPGGGV